MSRSLTKPTRRNRPHDPLLVPTRAQWAALTPFEQMQVETRIIGALERTSRLMGETTIHFAARASAGEVLQRYFKSRGRKAFVASDLHTLYPGERAFYPDLLVVFEVGDHHRRSWNVLREQKCLDFVLEIVSRETRSNDWVEKLNRYARLGIPEYFIYDPDRLSVVGYQLIDNTYHSIPAGVTGIPSQILGLSLRLDGFKLRFVHADGFEIPFADELIQRLNQKLADKEQKLADKEQELVDKEQELVKKERVIDDFVHQLEVQQQSGRQAKHQAQLVQRRWRAEKQKAAAAQQRADLAEQELQQLRALLAQNSLDVNKDVKGD